MREAWLAFAMFVLLAASAFALQFLDWTFLVWAGVACIAIGLVLGLPLAVVYHLKLWRTLQPRGALDPRWIWNPTAQHKYLRPDERWRVLSWFYAAVAAWSVSVLGCAMVALAAFLASRAVA